jgi:lipopolysaccharide export system protein LptA
MSISVAKLRVWLLVGAGLLVGVIVAFVGLAHYRAHRFIKNLPAKLGIDIEQETTGFTYSQSNGAKGRTIYTIHAAKAQQRKDGKLALHDVVIVLYGNGQGSTQRADRIYGNEFEYEQNTGVVKALGEVHIDLQAPAPQDAQTKSEYAKGKDLHGKEKKDEHLIHVTTSNLVFLQKLGTAATSEDLEFEYNGMIGHAHGADYTTDTGDLVLETAVRMNGVRDGRPAVLTASRAEYTREQELLVLERAEYTVEVGAASKRVTRAGHVTAFLRPDGSVERAVGEDGVSLLDEDGSTVAASRGEMNLNAANQPQTAMLAGEVRYSVDEPLRQVRGEADESHADFDKDGLLKHALLTGAVHMHERRLSEAGSQDGTSERDVVSKTMDLIVATDKGGHSRLQQAKAEGNARLTVVSTANTQTTANNKGKAVANKGGVEGKTTSVMSGDVLTGLFRPEPAPVAGNGPSPRVGTGLKTVVGEGHTVLRRASETGAEATSSGDTLNVEFRDMQAPVASGRSAVAQGSEKKQGSLVAKTGSKDAGVKSGGSAQGVDQISRAVQQGHVSMMNRPVAKPGTADVASEQHATAQRAVYDGDTDALTLTGAVQLNDADSIVWTDKVVMEHETGDGTAEGAVRVTYLQPKDSGTTAQEPVHVLAARGEFTHDTGRAMFYGDRTDTANGRARLWQGSSQVEAPVLEFEKPQRRLLAHGDGRSAKMAVHSVFVSGAPATAGAPAKTGSGTAVSGTAGSGTTGDGSGKQAPVRVESHDLVYDDVARRADFSGGVLVEDADGTLRAQQAAVFLTAANAAKAGSGDSAGATKAGADAAKSPAAQSGFMGGSVERMVASGGIEIMQPGRKVTGEQLVYTAADGMYVVTGRPGALPRMTDVAQGTITGAALRFHAGDNSVVVSNGPDSVAGQRVRTDTRVKQ